MGVLGPISSETRIHMARARRGTRPGLVETPLEFAPPPYWSVAELLFERARLAPDATYLVYYDDDLGLRESLSYGQVAERVRRVATFMKDELGLGPGDVIACADLHNHPDTIVILYAAWALGVIAAPINMREDRRRQQFILRHSNARAIFARDRQDPDALDNYLKRMTALAGDLGIPHVIQTGGDERRAAYWLDQVEPTVEPRVAEIFSMDTEAVLVYTSGVTGAPKGVVLTHAMLYAVRALAEQQGATGRDVFLTSMPLFHVNTIVSSMLLAAYVGSTLVLNRRFNPATFLERVEDEGVSVTSVVPAMLSAICRYAKETGIKVRKAYPDVPRNLTTVFCGAGQLYPSLAREVLDVLGLRVRHGWGMSETTSWGCQLPPDLTDEEYERLVLEARHAAIGTPNSAIRLGIIDPDTGEPLPAGEVGEIVAAGPGLMKGYYRNAVVNEKALSLGVLRTGDQGYYELLTRENGDELPIFYMTGRLTEVIQRGGETYSLLEIDADIMRIPVVERALTIGFRHDVYGQEVGAVICLKEGATIDNRAVWRHFMTLGYPWDKTPKVIRVVDEIPEPPTGKKQRRLFASEFAGFDDELFPRPDFWTKK